MARDLSAGTLSIDSLSGTEELTEFTWSFWAIETAPLLSYPLAQYDSTNTLKKYVQWGFGQQFFSVRRNNGINPAIIQTLVSNATSWNNFIYIFELGQFPQIYQNGIEIPYISRSIGSGNLDVADGK